MGYAAGTERSVVPVGLSPRLVACLGKNVIFLFALFFKLESFLSIAQVSGNAVYFHKSTNRLFMMTNDQSTVAVVCMASAQNSGIVGDENVGRSDQYLNAITEKATSVDHNFVWGLKINFYKNFSVGLSNNQDSANQLNIPWLD